MSGRDIAGKNRSTGVGDPGGRSSRQAIATFLEAARTVARPAQPNAGRLIFALDATMSRQPTWDAACRMQGEMFNAVARIGGLHVQLVYFRGFDECQASRWVGDTGQLRDLMTRIDCRAGLTQIARVLRHARDENARERVSAMAFIGDSVEEEIDRLGQLAGELGLRKVPCFMFQEGDAPDASRAFSEIARLSNGAYLNFGAGSADDLQELLKAVAVYASGGLPALERDESRKARLLLEQLSRRKD